jgi:hypothetical protein
VRSIGIVLERLTQLRHRARERRFAQGIGAPDAVDERVLGEDLARTLRHEHEQVHDFRTNMNGLALSGETVRGGFDQPVAEMEAALHDAS